MGEFKSMIEGANEGAELLKALSHPTRLMALCHIGTKEMCVMSLSGLIGTTQSNISQHLAKLRAAEIVSVRKQDNKVFYKVSNKTVLNIIQVLQKAYCPI